MPVPVASRTTRPNNPVAGHQLIPQMPTLANVRVDEHSALAYSAVWACVRIISETLATLDLVDMVRENGRVAPANSDLDHVIGVMANEEMSASTFRATVQAWALTHGNGYAELEKTRNGDTVAQYPIEPWRVRPDRTEAGQLIYDVTNQRGPNKVFEPSEFLHLKGLAFDGLIGYSIVRLARQAIAMGIAAENFGASFFGKALRPSMAISHPKGGLDDVAFGRLEESLTKFNAGWQNTAKFLLLEDGMTAVPMSIPPEDAQFLQTRQFQVLEIGPRWYGVPPFMLGDMDQAKQAGMEQLMILFVNHCIAPWARRWQDEGQKLYPAGTRGRFVKVDLRGLLRGDVKTRALFYKILFSIGVLSVNDIRQLEEWNDVEGGDARFVPMNMVPLARAEELAGGAQKPSRQRGSPPGDGDRESRFVWRDLAMSAASRLVAKECNAVGRGWSRALKVDEDAVAWFGDYVADFYAGPHLAHARAEVKLLVRHLVIVIDSASDSERVVEVVERVSRAHCQGQAEAAIAAFSACSDDEALARLMDNWDALAAAGLVEAIAKEIPYVS